MQIPIDAIRENGNLRRVKVTAEADRRLADSIRAQGVLQPILVRRESDDAVDYVLVAGHRRLRCAREVGLTEIPAEIQMMTEAWAQAAQAAENMVREPMHAIDQWRAVRDLAAGGMSFDQAATALGLTERQARRMEILGRMEPKLLALIEEHGSMPREDLGRIIAAAPRAMQAKAAKIKDAVLDGVQVNWPAIALACRVTRYSRSVALFDTDAIKWDVDFFAEPGADDEYTTTDGPAFLRLQQQAVESQVADLQAQKKRVRLAEWDAANRTPKLPAGFERSYEGDPDKPKKIECVFVAVSPDSGAMKRRVGIDTAARKAAEKKKRERQIARADAGDDADLDGPGDGVADDPAPPAPEKEKPGISKAGLAMVAAAKTEALRQTLHGGLAELQPERLLTLMLLAFGARNVNVYGLADTDDDGHYDPTRRHFADIADALLLPGGVLEDVYMETVRSLVGTVLARVLVLKSEGTTYAPSSGAPAEWIGAAIGADKALPRFDTDDFLKHVGGDELRAAATAAGEKATGSVKALREKLAGKMPDWRPACATFGAPAPVLQGRG